LGSTHAGILLYALYLQNIQDEQHLPTINLYYQMKKGLIVIAFATLAIIASKPLFANEVTANNCYDTANASDGCFTSDGSENIVVIGCRPSTTTDCAYEQD
jgi:hypothetical protein